MFIYCPDYLKRFLRNNAKSAVFLILALVLSAFTCSGEVFEDDDVLRNTGVLQADWIGVVDIIFIDDMPVEAPAEPPADPAGDPVSYFRQLLKPVPKEDLLKVKVLRVLYGQTDPPAKVVIDRFLCFPC